MRAVVVGPQQPTPASRICQMIAPRYSHKSFSIVAGAVHLHEPPPADTNLRKPAPAEFSVYRVEVAIRHELPSSYSMGNQKCLHLPAADSAAATIWRHRFFEALARRCGHSNARTFDRSALILVRSREKGHGDIGVITANDAGSVTGMLDAAGQDDEAAIGQLYRVLYTERRDQEKARLHLLGALL
jgi:hypothetical protein